MAPQFLARRDEVHSTSPYLLRLVSSSEWRMISGIWLMVKTSVIGMMPQTLNATHVSVEKLRQTIR